jgi:hypothetical protein
VDKLDAAINQGLKSPDLISSLGGTRRHGEVESPQDFCNIIAEETQNQGAIVISSGVQLD